MAWKAADRLIAMIASHFSTGKSSIGETNWMPALLTRMSSEPNLACASAIIAAISAGLAMSAPLWKALTPKSFSMLARSVSIAAASPMPFMIDVGAFLGQRAGDRQPDAAGRAGDEGIASGE